MNFQIELNRIKAHTPRGQVSKLKPRRERRKEDRNHLKTTKASNN
jgi:hypothetical protein